jgi:apolipoprotein N-acyltransferase
MKADDMGMPKPPASERTAWVLALTSGGLLSVAFPGTGDQAWLAFGALVPLLVAIAGQPGRRAALLGLAAGVVFWSPTIGSTAQGVRRYAALSWPQTALIFALLVVVLSAFVAVFCALVVANPIRSAAAHVVGGASVWVTLEFVRTQFVAQFPWNLLGYSQYRNLALIQVAAITGVYGISFVVAAVNVAIARLALAGPRWRDALSGVAVAVLALALTLAAGWLSPARDGAPSIPIALLQGNVDQAVKWVPAYQDATIAGYRELTLAAAERGARIIVWPETSVPLLRRDDPGWARIAEIARESGRSLLVGAPDWEHGRPRNSAFLFDPSGRPGGRYDKRHLVPLGEYVPYERYLGFLNWIAGGGIGAFVPGSRPGVLTTADGRVGVVICYEVIFPAEVRELFVDGAEVLVNITNDAWFGRSPVAVQHLAMAALRAVENRAYLARAANSGISAIIAPDGRIVSASGLFTREVVLGHVTPRVEASLYTRYGDVFAWLAVGLALTMIAVPSVGRRRAGAIATRPSSGVEPTRAPDPIPEERPAV